MGRRKRGKGEKERVLTGCLREEEQRKREEGDPKRRIKETKKEREESFDGSSFQVCMV